MQVTFGPTRFGLDSIANPAGSGAGEAVTVSVQFFAQGNIPLPLNSPYRVFVNPNQAAWWFVSNQTPERFDVTLTPPAGAALAAGTIDVCVIA